MNTPAAIVLGRPPEPPLCWYCGALAVAVATVRRSHTDSELPLCQVCREERTELWSASEHVLSFFVDPIGA